VSWVTDLGLRTVIPREELTRDHPSVCESKSGVWRREHSFDRDGKCVFCPVHVWPRETLTVIE
jgi:hypothetical protein